MNFSRIMVPNVHLFENWKSNERTRWYVFNCGSEWSIWINRNTNTIKFTKTSDEKSTKIKYGHVQFYLIYVVVFGGRLLWIFSKYLYIVDSIYPIQLIRFKSNYLPTYMDFRFQEKKMLQKIIICNLLKSGRPLWMFYFIFQNSVR